MDHAVKRMFYRILAQSSPRDVGLQAGTRVVKLPYRNTSDLMPAATPHGAQREVPTHCFYGREVPVAPHLQRLPQALLLTRPADTRR
jgi:hypothetical protein